jgi:hypothetical protein
MALVTKKAKNTSSTVWKFRGKNEHFNKKQPFYSPLYTLRLLLLLNYYYYTTKLLLDVIYFMKKEKDTPFFYFKRRTTCGMSVIFQRFFWGN